MISTSTDSESESKADGGSETATESGEPESQPFECFNLQLILQDTQDPSGWEQSTQKYSELSASS